jgi:GTP-binding protein
MDIRHPLKATDEQLLALAGELSLPVHILLNKADKLSRNQATSASFAMNKALLAWAKTQKKLAQITVQPFSAETRQGLEAFFEHLQTHWMPKNQATSHSTDSEVGVEPAH